MAQQTAVEWLKAEFNKWAEGRLFTFRVPQDILEKAKQMEKEQIIDAWREGDNDSMYSPKELDQQAEQYYNETFTSTPQT